ncbi:MAG: aldo/keto reductase [Bacteroidia bacterium]
MNTPPILNSLNGKPISPLGMGTSRIASIQSGLSPKQGLKLLEEAFAQGVNFIDTADIYGQGESENLVGKFIQNKRESTILASKAGFTWNSSIKARMVKLAKPILRVAFQQFSSGKDFVQKQRDNANQNAVIVQDFSPDYLRSSIVNSLNRLRTDYLDIFFLHEPQSVIHDTQVYQTLLDLKSEGLIRSIGLCTPSLDAWKSDYHPHFDVLQTKLSPQNAAGVRAFVALQEEQHNITPKIIAHAVFNAYRSAVQILQEHELPQQIVAKFEHEVNPINLLLAHTKSHYVVNSILMGTTNINHLQQNLIAFQSLPQFDLEELLMIESIFRETSKISKPHI